MIFEEITYTVALIAGLTSFFSPCILPLLPAYFSFITGMSIEELTRNTKGTRKKVFFATLFYVAGFSVIFILLGASASFLGSFAREYSWIIRYLGGTVVIIFGLHLLGIININALNFEKRIHLKEKPLHLLGAFVVGMAFGAGWTPCIGPQLGAILGLATHQGMAADQQGTILKGIILLSIYSAGLAIPFLVISIFINSILEIMKKTKKLMIVLNRISGILLIVIGLLLIFDQFKLLVII
ncbi:MAG: cytochrome c biogenesis protein CcdA [Proteobacteria bacterium]|nr:cytochrome c biogenesis protein CcdA [Pseudomonadota bacterium]MBU1386520.1 cytochrome c biogenesis protein CcdA [Pseudomonadota bacterium]MBU1544631.1 cytochrome c biogenesis protein CcdA [Pseudomonadota bacterium]MBU2481390.1 cytochrome c biogenesis protein CcdA [Pseudomonadota bacterium]